MATSNLTAGNAAEKSKRFRSPRITAERLRIVLDYDPITGLFRRRYDSYENGPHGYASGDIAGIKDDRGYIHVSIDGTRYLAHRLAWLYMTGEWPADQVDHINLDPGDNRWSELRGANNGQNKANGRLRKDNASGFKGVHLRESGKWRACIRVNKKLISLGSFATAEEAHGAYVRAAVKHFGEFARVA